MADNPKEIAEYQTDHDLLVKLNVQVDTLTRAVEKKNDDHEARIRSLERTQTQIITWGSVGVMTLNIVMFAAGFFLKK